MPLQVSGTRIALTDSNADIPVTLSSPSPTPTRPASADPTQHIASPDPDVSHDLFIEAKSGSQFPAIRARLAEHSPKLRQLIADLPHNGVLKMPEDDWVVEELRRWTNCTGLALPTDLEARPILSMDRRERLATLLRMANVYEVSIGAVVLTRGVDENFIRTHPVAAYILGVSSP
ncbi:hypothetical protein AURDEDRAFT_118447 [Auricularia subglabra TFB-10046 SS5]|nr:hypothetical protein AURDEDRAFT_118447 [Auricularia subglabra TFB-10046 SS5]